MDTGLVGRYFERCAHHAAAITRQASVLVTVQEVSGRLIRGQALGCGASGMRSQQHMQPVQQARTFLARIVAAFRQQPQNGCLIFYGDHTKATGVQGNLATLSASVISALRPARGQQPCPHRQRGRDIDHVLAGMFASTSSASALHDGASRIWDAMISVEDVVANAHRRAFQKLRVEERRNLMLPLTAPVNPSGKQHADTTSQMIHHLHKNRVY